MPQQMTIYEKIKDVLDANLNTLSIKIDANRDVSLTKFSELKQDINELKEHVKATNGHVWSNAESILILQEKEAQACRRRKTAWSVTLAVIVSALGVISVMALNFLN